MIHHFENVDLSAVVLDESSILKAFDGKMRNQIITMFGDVPYRLACTATPSPNDYMELGNHSEFLGVMSRTEMLSMFFVHDGGDTSQWRLKGHAEKEFWRWIGTWAVTLEKPSDFGYDDKKFILPALNIHHHVVESGEEWANDTGTLFAMPAQSLQERRTAMRASIDVRTKFCYKLIYENSGKTATIQSNLLPEAQRENAGKGAGVVSRESREDRSSGEENLSPRVLQGEPREIQTHSRATRAIQLEQKKSICLRSESSGEVEGPNEAVAGEKSREETGATTKEIRNNGSEIQIHSTEPETQLRDLRSKEDKTKDIPGGGSLSSKRSRSGYSVLELQSGDREIQGQRAPITQCGRIFREKWIVWVTLNKEQDALEKMFGKDCVSIQGSTPPEQKEKLERLWRETDIPIMLTKAKCFGFGMNWQVSKNMAFVGLSDSFEQFYQAVRRCWRFGQRSDVDCHIITGEMEGNIVANIKRKEADAQKMRDELRVNVSALQDIKGSERKQVVYKTKTETGKNWTLHLGDCVETMAAMEKDSIGYSVFSPPFASLYTYSASERDMGNVKNHSEFYDHFRFGIEQLFRVLMPGRLLSFHCMNLPTSKARDGVIGITDFRGELIRMFAAAGFIYHSEVCIWKDPVTAMQRTKALGLLHKQIKKDSCMSRQGIADYLVTMRKPGDNPVPVSHTNENFPVQLWQQYASPVWMDINPSDTLQFRSAREHKDERHICPLQLQVIERAIHLWTREGDLVLSPFAGIGSEGYVALKMGRRFVGAELKESYFKQACANLKSVAQQDGLFDTIEA